MQSAVTDKTSERVRLDYLDGLRGLAALYVVIYHAACGYSGYGKGILPGKVVTAVKFLSYGHFSVAVFIVLSGYCLMLPVAQSKNKQLRGGMWDYLKRRGRRILPPYYAALVLSLIVIALVPALQPPHGTGTIWDGTTPAFSLGPLLSHLFLVHNLSDHWINRINGPMWSVATEWQIYFFLPLVLLPLWRKFGIVVSVAVAFMIGLAPHFLLSGQFDKAVPWYLGLFALGMAGAVIGFSQEPTMQRCREKVPWGGVTALLWIFSALVGFGRARWWWANLWFADTFVGMATAALLVYSTRFRTARGDAKPSFVLQVMESAGAVKLGTFSYSLYLIHMPLLAMSYLVFRGLSFGPLPRLMGLLFVAIPVAVGFAYLFHLAFEKRFMSAHTPAKG